TSSTPSICATYGCTASTCPAPSTGHSNSALTTMVASSPTLSLNGHAAMASASSLASLALPVGHPRLTPTFPGLNTYHWTLSNSAARSLAAHPQPACSPPSSPSERTHRNHTKENSNGHTHRRSPQPHLSILDIRPRHRTHRLHIQPVPHRRR